MSNLHSVLNPSAVIRLALSALEKSPRNVRKSDVGDVSGLAASILANGLLHPLVVAPHGKRYAVISGWRRTLALRHLVTTKALGSGVGGS